MENGLFVVLVILGIVFIVLGSWFLGRGRGGPFTAFGCFFFILGIVAVIGCVGMLTSGQIKFSLKGIVIGAVVLAILVILFALKEHIGEIIAALLDIKPFALIVILGVIVGFVVYDVKIPFLSDFIVEVKSWFETSSPNSEYTCPPITTGLDLSSIFSVVLFVVVTATVVFFHEPIFELLGSLLDWAKILGAIAVPLLLIYIVCGIGAVFLNGLAKVFNVSTVALPTQTFTYSQPSIAAINVSQPTVTLQPTRSYPTITPYPTPVLCWNAQVISAASFPESPYFKPGATFEQLWQVRNIGTCDWVDVELRLLDGESMEASLISVPDTAAGKDAVIRVTMMAPNQSGHYQSIWQYAQESNVFGMITVEVEVREK